MKTFNVGDVYVNKFDNSLTFVVEAFAPEINTVYGKNNQDGRVLSYRIDQIEDYWTLDPNKSE